MPVPREPAPGAAPPQRPLVAIAANFTAEPLADSLGFWIRHLGWDDEIRFAPYNQVFQQLLDPAGLLAGNRSGVNAVLVRLEEWEREDGEQTVAEFVAALRAAAGSFRSPLLVLLCPCSPGCAYGGAVARCEAQVRAAAADLPGVHVVPACEIAALYPVADYFDPHGNELGHVPYTPEFFAALGTVIARKLHALRTAPAKVAVLDCDETLWRGVCAEDGPAGVRLDEGSAALHEFMAERRSEGMLLALASKNNEEDVLDTFQLHPELPLKPEHFVARRINWEPKSANVASLAAELNLGLDSFIFVDDNPAECAEVQSACPGVLAVPLPAERDRIGPFLRHIWAFDRLRTTAEDAGRSELYAAEAERTRFESTTASLDEFLAGLQLEVRIGAMEAAQAPRVSQLTQRTNQMNFTAIRRSEAEVHALVDSGELECLTVDVRDRFGSYGLVGAMLFRRLGDALSIDTFLLSCRALGRGVEHGMMRALGELARERGIPSVDAAFVPTARNSPARKFLAGIPAGIIEAGDERSVFRFEAAALAALTHRPDGKARHAAPASGQPAPSARKRVDYVAIATGLRTAAQVLARLRSAAAPAPARSTDAPRTEVERRLAGIWAELLRVPSLGVHDNFFDLGGHSLLAVQLLSRVRREFDVEVSLEVVYGGPFTIAELAKAIDVAEIERSASGEYAALLAEVESLSDEEVRALLAEEQERNSR